MDQNWEDELMQGMDTGGRVKGEGQGKGKGRKLLGEEGKVELGEAGLYQGAGKNSVNGQGLKSVTRTLDGVIDFMLANPHMSTKDIAKECGYTPSYLYTVQQTDAFQAQLKARKEELLDPILKATLEDRMKGLAQKSMEVVMERLSKPLVSEDYALEVMKASTKALGFGARQDKTPLTQNFVFQLPSTPRTVEEWEASHGQGQYAMAPTGGERAALDGMIRETQGGNGNE